MGYISDKALIYTCTDLKVSDMQNILSDSYERTDTQRTLRDKVVQWSQNKSFSAYTRDDSQYHFKLSLVSSAPYAMYMMGDEELLNRQIIAIVGPRKYSPYAAQVMDSLFESLSQYDVVTISGLADGVDKMCHELSMKYKIPTIAVLGGGMQHYLTGRDRELINTIITEGGLILSEFKLQSQPERYTFPQRNRIVAGLSDMVFLPEAGQKSGSLITVDFARQMHKDVYGSPNTIFSSPSEGLHQYMQQGLITPVVNWDWMLGKYFGKKISNEKLVISNGGVNLFQGEISLVVELLQKNPVGLKLEELVSQTGLGIEEVMSQLSMAEVMGQVRNDGGVWKMK